MTLIQSRKDDHIRICLENDVGSNMTTGLNAYQLEYDALPEFDLKDVDLSTTLFSKTLAAPILIGSMTGGSTQAHELNLRLARAAETVGLGMGLGSQRAMLQDPNLTSTFAVKESAPNLSLLIGNIGAVQLRHGVTSSTLKKMIEDVQADALYFHLNPLQEAIQPEGDTEFGGLFAAMQEAMQSLPFPCLLKEVGAGFSDKTAKKLSRLPAHGIEASGVGGTSWAKVESFRAPKKSLHAKMGENLRGFGVPTSSSIQVCRQHFGKRYVIGSGGIATAMDIAVAIALGADAVAISRPVLAAAYQSTDHAVQFLKHLVEELRVICFCTGAKDISSLRNVRIFHKQGDHI